MNGDCRNEASSPEPWARPHHVWSTDDSRPPTRLGTVYRFHSVVFVAFDDGRLVIAIVPFDDATMLRSRARKVAAKPISAQVEARWSR